jgi:hypothetical protein
MNWFHTAHGFVPAVRPGHAGSRFGESFDLIWMQKIL